MRYLIFIFLVQFLNLQASEVDNFFKRHETLYDSKQVINSKANMFFDEALEKANRWGKCSERRLYRNLRANFSNHQWGKLTSFILESPLIHRRKLITPKTIYGDFRVFETPILTLYKLFPRQSTGVIINYNGHSIGSDKFEHLFYSGYRLFRNYYLRGYSIEKVLHKSYISERYLYGGSTTGIISYGDLAANFAGLRFWNHILNKEDDIMGSEYNHGPYVKCIDNKWKRVKYVDFSVYVDSSWDEAINCSKFRTKSLVRKVFKKLKLLGDKYSQNLICPVDQEKLIEMNEKYAEFSMWFINMDGHVPVKY